MDVFNITTFSSFLVDIEHDNINYEVRVADTGLSWEYDIRDIDNNEDIEKDNPLYIQLLRAAEDAIDAKNKESISLKDWAYNLREIERLSNPATMRTAEMLYTDLVALNAIVKRLANNTKIA